MSDIYGGVEEPPLKKVRRNSDQDMSSTYTEDPPQHNNKVFNDPIHGHIVIHPLLVKIIDTPQFQRLRNIKQLGGCYFVYMGASHNRFEHSIGVAHLAGEMVEMLERNQKELGISEEDVLCVKIAGLCHDLGHGPFSHLWDKKFMPKAEDGCTWKHEQGSVMMFDHLIEVNNLMGAFEENGLTGLDVEFVKELIDGPQDKMCTPEKWPYKGRTEEKSFLYEIVANKTNGVDVDKWDYFTRDCHHLGISSSFDLHRAMKFVRVIEVDGRRQICTRDKEVGNLYQMFHTRLSLHRMAYQHKTSNVVELMLTEALLLADPYILLPGKDEEGRPVQVKMSKSVYNPSAYTNLTDHVIQQILASPDPELQESRELLVKIQKRELYKYISQIPIDDSYNGDIVADIKSSEEMKGLSTDDLVFDTVSFDYGRKDKNPVDRMAFYSKHNPTKAFHLEKERVSKILPGEFREKIVRVYCRLSDSDATKKCFFAWCKQKQVEHGGEHPMDWDVRQTPYGSPFKLSDSQKSASQETSKAKKHLKY